MIDDTILITTNDQIVDFVQPPETGLNPLNSKDVVGGSSEQPKNKIRLQKRSDGAVEGFNAQGVAVEGYQAGELNVKLPSGKEVNILADGRIPGQAQYQPQHKSFVFSRNTIAEIENPANNTQQGWLYPSQRAEYFLKHEYNHFVWDQIPPATRKQIVELFSHPTFLQATRGFGAVLISKPEYQAQEEKDYSVDCFEYKYGNPPQIHRFSKELIVNELLAHALIGEMMPREKVTSIQTGNENTENLGRRSKDAIDCLKLVEKQAPQQYEALTKLGLARNLDFVKDFPILRTTALNLKSSIT